MIAEYPYTILHISDDGCNKPFVYVNKDSFEKGEIVPADAFMKLDETIPYKGEQMLCGSCGKEVWLHNCKNEHIVKRHGSQIFNV